MIQAPTLREYMAETTDCIQIGDSLHDALKMMEKSGIPYLPVLEGSRLVGLLKNDSVRATARLLGSEQFTVGDVMAPNPAFAAPDTSLYEILDETPDHSYGCTVVQQKNGKVMGIFTPREAMRAVFDLAQQSPLRENI
jgi:CBS domain-containing protein